MPHAESTTPREFDWGFLASRQYDAQGNLRWKALGPLYENVRTPQGGRMWAFRPFYSAITDPERDWRMRECLWPVFTGRDLHDERSWRFLLAFYTDFDVHDPGGRYRFWIFPIYFQGRNAAGEPYLGVFPLGGKVYDLLGQDEVRFILFPLSMYMRVKDAERQDYLWPILSWSWGGHVDRFRVFPFYGRAVYPDRFDQRFIMWPFWSDVRSTTMQRTGHGYVLFPLWGHVNMSNERTWMAIPPLIRATRSERQTLYHCPWPFVQRYRGNVDKFYLWPLWGYRVAPGSRTAFFLWPLVQTRQTSLSGGVRRQFRVLPLWFHETVSTVVPAGEPPAPTLSRYHTLWPLWSYRREEDKLRFRCLELWPFRDIGAVEREYAPIWTLFSHTRVGENADDELLWGLYRHRRRGAESWSLSIFPLFSRVREGAQAERRLEWSVLHGLLGYRREGERRSLRVLYLLRFGGRESQP